MNKKILLLVTILLFGTMTFAGVVANEQGKCGYLDESGKVVIDYQYDFIGTFDSTGVALMKKNGKFGMISSNGIEVIPTKYTWISTPDEYGYRVVQSGKKYGMVAPDGIVTMYAKAYGIPKFSKYGVAIARSTINTSYYDLINREGKRVAFVGGSNLFGCFTSDENFDRYPFVPVGANWTSLEDLNYEMPQDAGFLYNPFYRQMAGATGEYNCFGNEKFLKLMRKFPLTYPCIHDNSKPAAKYRLPNGLGNRGLVGEDYWRVFQFLEEPSDSIVKFVEGYESSADSVTVVLGYYNLSQKDVIAQYSYNIPKSLLDIEDTPGESWTSTYYSILVLYLEYASRQLLSKIFDYDSYISGTSFHSGYAIIYYHGSTGHGADVINTKGEKVAHFADCYKMNDGYFVVEDDKGKGGIVDSLFNVIVPCQYSGFKTKVRFDKWWVKNVNKKWGAVNMHGKEVIPFAYDSVTAFINRNAGIVYKKGKAGLYAHTTQVMDCVYDSITNVWGNADGAYAAIAYKNGEGRMYNFENKKVSTPFAGKKGYWGGDDVDILHKKTYRVFNVVKGDTLYGYVDTNAEMFIPTVIDDPTDAINAYSRYKKLPTQQFTDEEIRHLKLYSKQYLQKYSLDAILSQDEWDY